MCRTCCECIISFSETSSSYAQISTIVSIFQWPCCSECLSFYLIRCRYCHWNSYSSYQHQNIHTPRHNDQNTAWILKCGGECARGEVHFSIHSSPSLTYSMALKSLESMAVLSGLCLRITACLLWTPVPTLKRCGPKMFYLLSGLASIKLMESIQLSSFPFPFRPQPEMRIH